MMLYMFTVSPPVMWYVYCFPSSYVVCLLFPLQLCGMFTVSPPVMWFVYCFHSSYVICLLFPLQLCDMFTVSPPVMWYVYCFPSSYVIGSVYKKLYPVICDKCFHDDTVMRRKYRELQGLSAHHLNVPKPFCTQVPTAVSTNYMYFH